MGNKTLIRTVTGSVFDANRAEGIAVFIPMGLVGIREEAEAFASMFGIRSRRPKDMVVCSLPEPRCGIARYLVYFDNMEKEILTVDDMRQQVNDTLDAFAGLGAKTVAMNAIRSRTLPDKKTRCEQYQRKFVEDYLEANPGVFDTVHLVDLRGGFNK
jgi:hypothetical protein